MHLSINSIPRDNMAFGPISGAFLNHQSPQRINFVLLRPIGLGFRVQGRKTVSLKVVMALYPVSRLSCSALNVAMDLLPWRWPSEVMRSVGWQWSPGLSHHPPYTKGWLHEEVVWTWFHTGIVGACMVYNLKLIGRTGICEYCARLRPGTYMSM